MALADQRGRDEQGRIEQTGSPREVFNAPRSEFVARFMGDTRDRHSGRQGAVRSDRLQLQRGAEAGGRTGASRVGARHRVPGNVCANPSVASTRHSDTPWTVTLPDDAFDAHPLQPGERFFVSWAPAEAHALI